MGMFYDFLHTLVGMVKETRKSIPTKLSQLEKDVEFGVKDYDALENTPIYNVSSDGENLIALRDLESGVYRLSGYFTPFYGSDISVSFSNNQLVNVVKKTAGSHIQIFYPVNNVIQFVTIMADEAAEGGYTYERKNIYLNDIVKSVNGEKPDENGNVVVQAGTQPDWNQNDSAAADYIKNRPFYGDLVIVPYPGVIGVAWYKVSDAVPTGDYSDGAACCAVVNGEKKNDTIYFVTDDIYTAVEMSIFVALNDNAAIEGLGITFPKKGTYFIASVGMPLVTGFALGADEDPEITWNGRASDIKTLDEKFFPSKMIILDASDGVTLVDENNNRINSSDFTERIIKGDLPCYRNATTYVFSSEVSVDMKNLKIQVYNRFAGGTTTYKISADSDGYITLDVYVG